MQQKVKYTYEMYLEDLEKIKPYMINIENIVVIYRGTLPIGTHLSNLYNVPLSIINFQSRDGDSKIPEWGICTIKGNEKNILIIDDIFDTGYTIRNIDNFLRNEGFNEELHYLTIYGKENNYDVKYLREHDDFWIDFWWEV